MFIKLWWFSKPRRKLREKIWLRLQRESGLTVPCFSRPLILQPAFLVLILVLVGGFSTGVYAYESPAVQEGHILQPIKRGLEIVQVRLARAPEVQARVRLQLAERRLREVEYKKRRGQFNEKAFNQVGAELDQAEQLVPTIKNQIKRQAISNHLERVRVLRIRGGQDLINVNSKLDPGRSTSSATLFRQDKEIEQIKLNKGKRLNYLDYLTNPDKESKPKIKYDQKQQNIRSELSSFGNARSIRKSSRIIKTNKISQESPAKSQSRN